jgi:hypothetical protein
VKPDFAWLKENRIIALAVVCGVVGFLAAMLIFGKPWHLPPAWGDLPTWIAAIAAIGAGIIAYQLYRISEDDRRSAQAAKVAAWYGSRQQTVMQRQEGSVQSHPVSAPIWGAYLRNASDLLVYDVKVRFYFPGSGDPAECIASYWVHRRTSLEPPARSYQSCHFS